MRKLTLPVMIRAFKFCFLISWFVLSVFLKPVAADLYINVLAVNGTEEKKSKDVLEYLPKELKKEDILETDGLGVEYDVEKGQYFLKGTVELGPKDGKTLRIRIRDIWRFDPDELKGIKDQINNSYKRIEGTEYADVGEIKRETLLQRLDFVVSETQGQSDNIEKRISRYRTYAKEVEDIRNQALSVKYWRATPPDVDEDQVFKMFLTAENPSDQFELEIEQKHYLPAEVKPEHLVNVEGFEVKYDPAKKQSYLTRTETLKPGERKSSEIGIVDVWNIEQTEIENLKERARKTYKFLEKSQYAESADYLIENIKAKIEEIELSQQQERSITEHISAYRDNQDLYAAAMNDVKSMEELLEAVRENLERSKLKNVLEQVQALRTIKDISKAIFSKKPTLDKIMKIILGIIIFVGVITVIHFAIWGKRSKDKPIAKTIEIESDKKEEES